MRYLLGSYRYILFAAPFLACLVAAYCCDTIPGSSAIGKALGGLAEEGLGELLKKNGFASYGLVRFQLLRFLLAAVCAAVLAIVLGGGDTKKALLLAAAFFVGFYKLLYFYMLYRDRMRIAHLNAVLPYTIKSIAYLANVYPVNNALQKALPLVPQEFRYDLRQLLTDIDRDPTSFAPYQAFIDRYNGRLRRLDYYFKMLYQISVSAGAKEPTKLLANLNETISEEMRLARRSKNNATNKTVTYLGLIPVALLTVMLVYLMVLMTDVMM